MPPKAKKAYTPPKSLAAFREAQEKKYDETRLIRLDQDLTLDFIPSGVTGLDVALGGGWARGRIHQILGKPGCCKTAMCVIALREALKKYPDEGVAYIDVEQTLRPERMLALGVNPRDDRVLWSKPKTSEEASDMLRDNLRTGLFSLAVVDSIGGLERSDAIYEKSAEDSDMGKNAQVITRMSKQVASIGDENNVATIFVNQYRKDFSGAGFDQAAGPMILGYYTTDSVVMRRLGSADDVLKIKEGSDEIEVAHKVAAKVERSKIRTQGARTEFWYNKVDCENGPAGVDIFGETFVIAGKYGVITSSGNWWALPDGTKENGEKAVKARLRAEPDLLQQIRDLCVKAIEGEMTPENSVSFVETAG